MRIYIVTENSISKPFNLKKIRKVFSSEKLAIDYIYNSDNISMHILNDSILGYEIWDLNGNFIGFRQLTFEEFPDDIEF